MFCAPIICMDVDKSVNYHLQHTSVHQTFTYTTTLTHNTVMLNQV